MTLAMMFIRPSLEMVKVDLEDRDCTETGAIGWPLSVLATVAVEIETVDLLRREQVSKLWPKRLLDCWR